MNSEHLVSTRLTFEVKSSTITQVGSAKAIYRNLTNCVFCVNFPEPYFLRKKAAARSKYPSHPISPETRVEIDCGAGMNLRS